MDGQTIMLMKMKIKEEKDHNKMKILVKKIISQNLLKISRKIRNKMKMPNSYHYLENNQFYLNLKP